MFNLTLSQIVSKVLGTLHCFADRDIPALMTEIKQNSLKGEDGHFHRPPQIMDVTQEGLAESLAGGLDREQKIDLADCLINSLEEAYHSTVREQKNQLFTHYVEATDERIEALIEILFQEILMIACKSLLSDAILQVLEEERQQRWPSHRTFAGCLTWGDILERLALIDEFHTIFDFDKESVYPTPHGYFEEIMNVCVEDHGWISDKDGSVLPDEEDFYFRITEEGSAHLQAERPQP